MNSKIKILIAFLCGVIITLVIMKVPYLVYNKQNKLIKVESNKVLEENTKQLQNRVKQLEETTLQLIGEVPEKDLYPVSGIVVSEQRESGNMIILNMYVLDLDLSSLEINNLEEVESLVGTNQKMIIAERYDDTKINFIPLNKIKNAENFDNLNIAPQTPYAVSIQSETPDPENQKRIKVHSMTIYYENK